MLHKELSAIILAGGRSKRLGQDKALLPYRGVSLVQHQVYKLQDLGIEDIIIAGYAGSLAGTVCVSDIYPHCGPLGGMHAGLSAITHPAALVLAVDTPLLPAGLLNALIAAHSGGATIAAHSGEIEPLIGVYDRSLSAVCEELLRGGRRSVRALLDRAGYRTVRYQGSEDLLLNCNTLEDYARLPD